MKNSENIVLIRDGYRYLDGKQPLTEVFFDASADGGEVVSIRKASAKEVLEGVALEAPKAVFVNVGISNPVWVNASMIGSLVETSCDQNELRLKAPFARIDKDSPDSMDRIYTRFTQESLENAVRNQCREKEIPEAEWPAFIQSLD